MLFIQGFKKRKMEKVIKNGEVAILVSGGFGAGWYSWNTDHKELLFHPKIVAMVESGKSNEINGKWVLENLGIADVYCGGAHNLKIVWLKEGTAFIINEYDGSESLETADSLTHIA